MRRRQWFEIHDQPRFPNSLRDLVTDTLQTLWNFFGFYEPIVPRLRKALQEARTHQILDLCSGGGGPWPRLMRDFEDDERFPVNICLTDKFPNPKAFERAQGMSHTRVVFRAAPVDATCVPPDLHGFRTIFSSFHHFPPDVARAILRDAVERQQGVGVFELPRRDWLTLLLVSFIPVMAFALAPFIRPFRWSRLLWTYLIPVVPFVVWFDGVVSCLRAYTPAELRNLTQGLGQEGYRWDAGEVKNGRWPAPITYLIGYPIPRPDNQMLSSESGGINHSI
jgi:hypothetical protein